jgi:hypothetical protein
MQQKGTVKLLGRQGCPIGEVRISLDGKCHKLLTERPGSYSFNVRDIRTGKTLATTIPSGKDILSKILTDAKWQAGEKDVAITIEKVLWDSAKDRPLKGTYVFRDKNIMKTGYVK